MKTTTTGIILSILYLCPSCVAEQDSPSQKVLFENSIVRVLEFQVPPGKTEPLRHPSLFIALDSINPARWRFTWMQPETLRAIENTERNESSHPQPWKPATLRIELKRSPSPNEVPSWPDELDAVRVAPDSHKVLFENSMLRILEVRVPPGTKEPFHNHRWPSIFIYLDSGGPYGAQRYYNKDGQITHDTPRREAPAKNPPEWRVKWMEPEPLHAIENMETVESSRTLPYRPATIRVEFKPVDSAGSAINR
jgi:hypothetical protein